MQLHMLWIFLLFISSFLQAEVEQVVITWNPVACKNQCPRLLQDNLQKAKGVAKVEVHGDQGLANIVWDKKIPFSFSPINQALRFVGVREKSLRVKVSGYIHGSGSSYTLTSRGDNTNFVLFNRAAAGGAAQYNNLFNPTNRVLSPDLVAKLEEVKKGNTVAIIEGPIFMWQRSPPDPLRLVIDSITKEEAPPSK